MPEPAILVQARLSSTRFPNKVLYPLANGLSMLRVVVRRCEATGVKVLACLGENKSVLVNECMREGVPLYIGPEADVLTRFYGAAAKHEVDPIIRVTADCPFVCPDLILQALKVYEEGKYDLVSIAAGVGASSIKGKLYPDGVDTEVFSRDILDRAYRESTQREHPTEWIFQNAKKCLLRPQKDYGSWKLSVDEPEDINRVLPLFLSLYSENETFGWKELEANL